MCIVGLKFRRAVGALCLGASLLLASAATLPLGLVPQANAESGVIHLSSSTNTKTIKVSKGKPKTIRTDASFSEIVVGDPGLQYAKRVMSLVLPPVGFVQRP